MLCTVILTVFAAITRLPDGVSIKSSSYLEEQGGKRG